MPPETVVLHCRVLLVTLVIAAALDEARDKDEELYRFVGLLGIIISNRDRMVLANTFCALTTQDCELLRQVYFS